jgi:hypothetical protein
MQDNTVVRAVTLPVGAPVGCTWEQLNEALVKCWAVATDLVNWCVAELYTREPRPFPREGKMPGMPSLGAGGLYRFALGNLRDRQRPQYPRAADFRDTKGVVNSAGLVVRHAERKYKQMRFDVLRRHMANLLHQRSCPYPIHNREWKADYADGGFPVVNCTLPGLGKVGLRLKRRADFGRQLAGFKALHDGTAKKGEAALYRDRKGNLLVKLVGHFPRRERGGTPNVAFVHTDPNSLLVVEINGSAANVTNGDHVRREIAKHRAFRQRAGEDKKREVRMDPRQRKNFDKYIAERCDKQNARLKTFVQQIAAQVARMCERQRVGTVCYDDANRNYFRSGEDELPFPWSDLKTRLQQLLGCNSPGEPATGELGCGWIDGQFAHITEEGGKEEWLRQARALLQTARKVSAHKSRPPRRSHPAVSTTRGT